MNNLGITKSVCPACRELVQTKVVEENGNAYFQKFCPEHGESKALVSNDVEYYLQAQRYVKPASLPLDFSGDSSVSCPDGCGFCERHEQHLCMPIVEITSRCDLDCPICIADAGKNWDMSTDEFAVVLESLMSAEPQIDVLNFSGGEPLLHPQILELVDMALAVEGIIRVSISTNGLMLLRKPELLLELSDRNVVVSLQFDGFDDQAWRTLRGKVLLAEKLEIIDTLKRHEITTSLTMTLASGVNTNQLGAVIDFLFDNENIVSLMIQPLSFAGRGEQMRDEVARLTIPDVIKLLDECDNTSVSKEDFTPLPCSHPLCFSLAFYLKPEKGSVVSMGQLIDADKMLDSLANKVVFGLDADEYERIKQMIYELWSGPVGAVPESEFVLSTLRQILREMSCCSFDPKVAFRQAEKRVKSIFIHAFMDVENFDLARVRRCCQAYPQPDGKLIPACIHNVLGGRKS